MTEKNVILLKKDFLNSVLASIFQNFKKINRFSFKLFEKTVKFTFFLNLNT